ncbi:MAG: RNA methyltransferase [Ruminococcaceae bacterium]|nr:RNA methyltransferase [Oscillospiraceae bacterium]
MKKEQEKQKASSYIEGHISLEAVYQTSSRKVEKVFISKDKKDFDTDRKFRRLREYIKQNQTPAEYVTADFFQANAIGTTHGGIMASVGERKMMSLGELLDASDGFIAILEGIEDPYNFGYSVRSLYAAGADGMILTPRNWLSAAGVCIRASAGTSEKINCAVCEDYALLKEECRKRGYTVYCAVEPCEDSVSIYNADFKKPMVLIIGGEKRGISEKLMECCDKKITIEYGGDFKNALTTAAASAVIGFEVLRQTKEKYR